MSAAGLTRREIAQTAVPPLQPRGDELRRRVVLR